MADIRKWRVTATYHRTGGMSSYSFTLTLANLYDAYTKQELEIKDNYPIANAVCELAMIKATDGTMSREYPLMSLHIKPG